MKFKVSGAILVLFALGGMAAEPHSGSSLISKERISRVAGWLSELPMGFGESINNREAWGRLAGGEWDAIVKDAERLARTPVPELTDELFLDFSKTGNRTRCQRVLSSRDNRVVTLALAECLENRGRFIQPLTEAIAAQCAEKTWVMPAHDGRLENFKGQVVDMDLRATLVGWELATIDWVLGEQLPDPTRDLIRREVRRRILVPFRAIVEGRQKGAFWLSATHNWNSVCLAGVTGAALALESDRAQRAWFVAAAEQFVQNFLRGFTPDGYCSEGVGYWNYGFGRFLMLTELTRQATGGKLDLLTLPNAASAALYASRMHIINGLYPPIADCHPGSQPDPQLVAYINGRFGLKSGSEQTEAPGRGFAPALMFVFLPRPLPVVAHSEETPVAPLRTWFKDGGVLICRPAAGGEPFAAVLKGGHNAEHHNHNDVGSFSVISGDRMVLCDPGAEVYTARTFSSRRYDSKVLNSYGHSVPVLAGKVQRTGSQARGVVLRTDFAESAETLALDIRSAYPVVELKQMERTFTFRRGRSPALVIVDQFGFESPQTFETALITWGSWKQNSATELLVTDGPESVTVHIDAAGQEFSVSAETLDEDVTTRTKPVRIGVKLKAPVQQGSFTLTVKPAGKAKQQANN